MQLCFRWRDRGAFRPFGVVGLLLSVSIVEPFRPAAALAQDLSDELIIVTAQKREEAAITVPAGISVLGAGRLEDEAIGSVRDVAGKVPGFTATRSYRGAPIYTLRGVGFNSPNLSATLPVGIYFDEVAYPFPAMSEGLLHDLERVEVVKGPQGTLFGRNTTGGLVNHIARKPSDEWTGHVIGHVGSFAGRGADIAVGGPLTDRLSMRVALAGEWEGEGWQYSVSRNDRLGEVNRKAARLSLAWEPGESTRFLLTFNHWRDRSETQAPQAFRTYPQGLADAGVPRAGWESFGLSIGLPPSYFDQGFDPRKAGQADWVTGQLAWGGSTFTPAPLDLRKDNYLTGLTLRAERRLSDATALTLLTAFTRYERDEVSDGSGFSIENAILQGLGSIETQSHELRLTGEGPDLDWIAGLSYSRDEVTDLDRSWVGTNSSLQLVRALAADWAAAAGADPRLQNEIFYGLRDAESRARQDTDSYALYAQADWTPARQWQLTLGGRYTRDRTDFAGCSGDIGDGNLAVTLNAFYAGLGIPSTLGAGDCVTFLGDIGPALSSGGAVPFPDQGLVRDRLTENSLSGKAAVAWHPSSDTTIYLSLSRGTKSGQFPNIEANLASQYIPATKEKLLAGEIGVKARPARWLTVEAAGYYYDYRDKQTYGAVPDLLFNSLTRIVNIPKSHAYGFDLAIAAEPSAGFRLNADLALLHSRIDRYDGYDDLGVPRDFSGGSFAYAPGVQLIVRAARRLDLSQGWSLTPAVDMNYSSAAHGDLLNEAAFRVPDRMLLGGSIALTGPGGRAELILRADNLTDEYRWNGVHYQGDTYLRFAERPRRFRLSARYGF